MSIRRSSFSLLLTGALAVSAIAAQAQNLFAPVISVNDGVITAYELDQRARFLSVLQAGINAEEVARDQLIGDRLKAEVAEQMGMDATEEGINNAIANFAERTNLKPEELIKTLGDEGIDEQTLRDFVKSNIIWGEIVRVRFAGRIQVTEEEIDRASASGGSNSAGLRVLLSEIFIPVNEQNQQAAQAKAQELSQLKSISAFSDAARQYSAAGSRNKGGRLNWMSISNLPPALQPAVLSLSPGEVTAPIPVQNAIALFQMRGIEEAAVPTPRIAAVEYAMVYLPEASNEKTLAEAAALASRIDTCDDLYGEMKDQPPEALERISQVPSEIPRDIALELAKLDRHEVSTALRRNEGQTLVLLMLCGRTESVSEDASREDIANALRAERLNSFAESYLDQLRANARIVER